MTYSSALGERLELFFWFLQGNIGFERFSYNIKMIIDSTSELLLLAPITVVVLFISGLSWWLHRRLHLTSVVFGSLFLIANLGLWRETMQTLTIIIYASLMSMLIGVPIGVIVGHRPWLNKMLSPVLDLMQTLPSFIYLIPTLVLFGLGSVPALISTVIFSMPSLIRFTQVGISTVPALFVEVGKSFGATKWQLFWKVEMPHALPSIMAGVNQCVMLSLSMVVISAIVGAGGLGTPVFRALNTVNIPLGFEAGIAVVLLSLVLDRLTRVPKAGFGRCRY